MGAFGLWFGGSHLGFGTHMPALAAAVLTARPGPVLEYGLGFYSTPLLHCLCLAMGRDHLSLDGDPRWAEQFAGLREPSHRILGFERWADSEPIVDAVPEWAVVFIDHGPNERRVVDAKRLATKAEFVVVHDWAIDDSAPHQRELSELFLHKRVYGPGPHTAVLSNTYPYGFPKFITF